MMVDAQMNQSRISYMQFIAENEPNFIRSGCNFALHSKFKPCHTVIHSLPTYNLVHACTVYTRPIFSGPGDKAGFHSVLNRKLGSDSVHMKLTHIKPWLEDSPIVKSWTGWNLLSVNWRSRHDFPTPEKGKFQSQGERSPATCQFRHPVAHQAFSYRTLWLTVSLSTYLCRQW